MPRFLSLLLLITALLGGCAHHPVTTVESSAQSDNIFKSGVLWKISVPGVADSYLLGTVHSEDARILAVGEAVMPYMMQATTLAVEVLLDKQNSEQASRAMFFTDGRNLRELAGEKLYQQSVRALAKHQIGEEHARMMKPWAVFTVLSMPESSSGQFMDAVIYQRAQQAGKKLVGLESMAEQIAVFDQMGIQDQLRLLEDTLKNAGGMEKMLEDIIALYLRADLEGIERNNGEYMGFTDAELAARVNERLLYKRNTMMYERMQPLLKQGGVFVAVGTLHLVGEQGLLRKLHDAGYTLQMVR